MLHLNSLKLSETLLFKTTQKSLIYRDAENVDHHCDVVPSSPGRKYQESEGNKNKIVCCRQCRTRGRQCRKVGNITRSYDKRGMTLQGKRSWRITVKSMYPTEILRLLLTQTAVIFLYKSQLLLFLLLLMLLLLLLNSLAFRLCHEL